MLKSVLSAPISYFESTPMGRILNRFTYDMEVMDITLTQNMGMFLISTGWYVTGVVIMLTILPWIGIAVAPVSLLYLWFLMHYRKSGPDLQRLDASSRSPVQAMVAEGTFHMRNLEILIFYRVSSQLSYCSKALMVRQVYEYSGSKTGSLKGFVTRWIVIAWLSSTMSPLSAGLEFALSSSALLLCWLLPS